MKQMKNSLVLVLMMLIFVVLGCNLFNQRTSETAKDNSEMKSTDSGDSVDDSTSSEMDDSEMSETTIPDLDFPDDDAEEKKPIAKNKFVTVKFAKGGTSRAYKDSVETGATNVYTIGAAKGQTMSVKLSAKDSNAVFYVKSPDGKFLGSATNKEPTDNHSGILPSTGKYRIVVSSTKGSSEYNINFAVSGKTPTDKDNSATVESVGGLTTVVKFKKGGTSATYKNAVIRGERNKYILGASAGQLMTVNISSLENNAVFDIQSPSGKTVVREVRNWSGQLGEKGRYRIIVGGTRGNATYTVRFAVR